MTIHCFEFCFSSFMFKIMVSMLICVYLMLTISTLFGHKKSVQMMLKKQNKNPFQQH